MSFLGQNPDVMADLEKFMGLGPDDHEVFITQDNASAYGTAQWTVALAKHTSQKKADPKGEWMYDYPDNANSPWLDQAQGATSLICELATMSNFDGGRVQAAISEFNNGNTSEVYSKFRQEEDGASDCPAEEMALMVSKLKDISHTVLDDPVILEVALIELYEGNAPERKAFDFMQSLKSDA
jgi:hypothetical protein